MDKEKAMECFLSTKRNEVMIHATESADLEGNQL